MKPAKYLLFLLTLLIFTSQAKAQYPGMRAVYANMDRQFMAQQMQMQMNMMMLNRYYGNLQTNIKYTFTVTLKDSSKKEVSSKIYLDTILHKNYLVLENKKLPKADSLRKQRIYPGQTLNISREFIQPFYKNTTLVTGMANDSCWLFKVISGSSISVYSFLSAREGGDFEPVTVAAIQKDNGPIVKVNQENLEAMVTGDEDAIKALLNKNYLKAIRVYNKHYLKAKKDAAASAK